MARGSEFSKLGRRNETLDVEGVDELAQALAKMADAERHQAMRAGFDEASAFVLREMKSRVARGKSGDLASNLTRVVNVRAGKVTSAVIGPRSKGKRDRWWSNRARWIELGTRDGRKIKPSNAKALSVEGQPFASADHRGIRAQPFMRPSIEENVDKVAGILIDGIRNAARATGFEVR